MAYVTATDYADNLLSFANKICCLWGILIQVAQLSQRDRATP